MNNNTDQILCDKSPYNVEIRIFLSSTFCDLQEERSVIVNKVAAALNKRYNDKGIKIIIVDLRWGVTDEAARDGKVIEICLGEIQKSRPYFAAIIGGRYGWQPTEDEIRRNKSLCRLYPNVLEDVKDECSITEMEIQYAFLKDNLPERQCIFFFKELDCVDDTYKDTGKPLEHLFNLRASIATKAKDRLCTIDTFKTPEALGDFFYRRVCDLIDKDFPAPDSSTTPKWIFSIQNNKREYESVIGEKLWMNLKNKIEARLPSKYRRFSFYSSHANDSIGHILASLSFKKIPVDDTYLKDFKIEETYGLNYKFIPVDIDQNITTAEKFLQLFLYIYRQDENVHEYAMNYGELVKTVKNLIPERPIICIIRNLDNLPPDELAKLAFLNELNEWIGFIIMCREASYYKVFNLLGIDENDRGVENIPDRLNIAQYLEVINNRLKEWSKELSASQRIHLLLCPSFGRFHNLNMFLEIINRFGYYDRLNKVIERFVRTRSDKEFTNIVIEMYEHELGREPVRWLLTRIAENNAPTDETELRDAFLRHFNVNALEWAAYACMLENLTDKISACFYINNADTVSALSERYSLDVASNQAEKETGETGQCSETELSAEYEATADSKSKHDNEKEESEYVRNLPTSLPDLVQYARISVEDMGNKKVFQLIRNYADLLKKMKKADLLNGFIKTLRETDSNDNSLTLLWIAMTGISPDVRFDDALSQIIVRLRRSPDPKLLKAFTSIIFICGSRLSDMEIFRDSLGLLHLIYEVYPEMPDFDRRIISTIAEYKRQTIYDIPDLSGVCNFAIKWISDDIAGRLDNFVHLLCGKFKDESWNIHEITYIEFLKSFADFFSHNAVACYNARQELLSVFEDKLVNLPMHLKTEYGSLMLHLGYDTQSAKTAILEGTVDHLGMCEYGSKKQTRFLSHMKELNSFPGYTPPVSIRALEICNLLMTGHFADADAVSREGFNDTQAFDFLKYIFKGEWDEAVKLAGPLVIYSHLSSIDSKLYFEARRAMKIATLLVYLYHKHSGLERTIKDIDTLGDCYSDHVCECSNENLWSLRKLIAAVYAQRMGFYNDAEELFRQACQPTATEDDDFSLGFDCDISDLELLNVLKCLKRNESPVNINHESLEAAIIVPGAMTLVYLYEKLSRLNPAEEEHQKTASLIESIRYYRLTDKLISLIPEEWRKRSTMNIAFATD